MRTWMLVAVFIVMIVLLLMAGYESRADDSGFHGKVEFGYVVGYETELPDMSIVGEGFVTEFEIGYLFDLPWDFTIDLVSHLETRFEGNGMHGEQAYPSFAPFGMRYGIEVEVGWRFTYLKWEHACTHPVYSNVEQYHEKWFGMNVTRISCGVYF